MSEIQEPRDQAATMASDWEWLKRTIMMIHDRALMPGAAASFSILDDPHAPEKDR